MHAESGKARAVESARLLGSGFAQLRREIVAQAHSPITGEIAVRNGRPKTVRAVTGAPLVIVLPRGAQAPTPRLIPLPDLQAPLAAGDTIGVVELPLGNADVIRVPALAESAIEKANLFQQFLGIFGG
jgi:D-alanyl-D-alanine carboxypeptidase